MNASVSVYLQTEDIEGLLLLPGPVRQAPPLPVQQGLHPGAEDEAAQHEAVPEAHQAEQLHGEEHQPPGHAGREGSD